MIEISIEEEYHRFLPDQCVPDQLVLEEDFIIGVLDLLQIHSRSISVGHGLFGHLDGSYCSSPRYVVNAEGEITSTETEEYKVWKQTDMILLSLLLATLDEDIVDIVIGCKSAKQAWSNLQERFSLVSRVSIMQLKTEMHTIKKGSDSIEKYLQKVKNARDRLTTVGVTIPDEDIIIVILNGLPDEYAMVRTVVEGRDNPISMRDLRAKLLAAEKRIEGNIGLISNLTAMVARNNYKGCERNDNYRQLQIVDCQTCGKRGHSVDTFFKVNKCKVCGKYGHLTSKCFQNPEYKTNMSSQITISPECQICFKKGHTLANCFQRAQTEQPIPTCQICGLKGHVALDCSHRTNFAYKGTKQPPAITALKAQTMYQSVLDKPQDEIWIGDSGETHHTSNFQNLSVPQSCSSDQKITIGNCSGLDILHCESS